MAKRILVCTVLAICFFHTAAADETNRLKQKIQKAVESNILTPFDISFETYVNLEMWDELRSMFQTNRNIGRVVSFPGIYYSRPYIINNTVWVFENRSGSRSGPFVFEADSLKPLPNHINEEFLHYEGGIRHIYQRMIISGAPDKNVDAAAVWDTKNNSVRMIALEEGHYIVSVSVHQEKLYIGACGGVINVRSADDLTFEGIYAVSNRETVNWSQFNKRECIVGVHVFKDRLYGLGERSVFVWNLKNRMFIKSYPKAISNSTAFFYKNYLMEYSDNYFTVSRLEDGIIISDIKTPLPIEDMIATSEKLVGEYAGDMIVLSLRHNKGILFYDLYNFQLIRKLDVRGINLCAYGNSLFATDDRHLYQYRILNHNPDKFNTFVKNTDLNRIQITDENYFELAKLAREYPDFISFAELTKGFLKTKHMNLDQSVRYGKIGNTVSDASVSSRSPMGYKGIYQLNNLSDDYYFITMTAEGSGLYGNTESEPPDSADSSEAEIRSFYHKSFFITPSERLFSDHFDIGAKEPRYLFIYPTRIQTVSKPYYEGFVSAMSAENKDIGLVDAYLDDDMVKDWRGDLEQKKNRLIQNQGALLRIFRVIRNIF